jgi:hypothetical protein
MTIGYEKQLTQHQTEVAVLKCVEERGVDRIKLDDLAPCLGTSRAGAYRGFGSVREVLTQTHASMLGVLNMECPRSHGDRRVEIEDWWAGATAWLRTATGRGFLSIRSVVAVPIGIEALVKQEIAGLNTLRVFISKGMPAAPRTSTTLACVCWLTLLSASACEPETPDALGLREVAWSVVEGLGTGFTETELDITEAVALEGAYVGID